MRTLLQSVWSKMVISYFAVVLVIALLLGLFFYLFFSHKYSEEIRINKQMTLNNAVNNIESSVIERVNGIYLSLALESSIRIDLDTFKGNHSKVLDIQQMLKKQVQNHSDLIQAIHLYDTEHHYMISSLHGLQLSESIGSVAGSTANWIDAMKNSNDSYVWMQTRMVPQDPYIHVTKASSVNPLISYVHSYPFQSSGQDAKLMIAIDIKESAISRIINAMIPADYERTFIVDGDGVIISAADKSLLGKPAEEHSLVHSLLSSNYSEKSYTHTFDHDSYVVSHDQIPVNEWSIYTATPAKSFYYKMDGLKQSILILCLLAIAVGLAMSVVFTAKGYKPLKQIMNSIKLRHGSPAGSKQNEYRFIDTAIHSLSNKIDSLEETLQVNHKMIKHNIILNILHNKYTQDELSKQLQSIGVAMDFVRFRCMIIDPVSEKWNALQPKQLQHAMYSMIQQLERATFQDTQLLAEELQDHKMVVVICTNKQEDQLIHQIADFIHSEVRSNFGLEFAISLGGWVHQLIHINTSYREAKILIRYSYFIPDQSVIHDLELLNRDTSSLEIPDSYLMSFEKKLQARDRDGAVQAIENIILTIKEGMYSAEYGRIILLKIVSIYSDCMSQVRWQPIEASSIHLYKQFAAVYTINAFSEWIISLITEFIQHVEKRSEKRSSDTVNAVKLYINEHISDDLTLEHVSEQVFISPKYLSKIFKEETGITFSEYVTQQRMARARELMEQQELTVEQVASTVGYRTSAYFIKKFKEIHGCTPKSFMRGLMS